MAEYIEREAAIRAFNGAYQFFEDEKDVCRRIIKSVSAADVAPVVHGRWVSLTECANEGVYCSVCHKKVYKADYAWSNKRIKMRSAYCPNCGARMDGDNDG